MSSCFASQFGKSLFARAEYGGGRGLMLLRIYPRWERVVSYVVKKIW